MEAALVAWSDYEGWHELFDAVCLDRGHPDNARLASELCTLTGTTDQAGYETAVRNLANWRRGQHVPHRKNFIALSTLLEIDAHEDLKLHWNSLFSQTKQRGRMQKSDTRELIGGPGKPTSFLGARGRMALMIAGAVALSSIGTVYVQSSGIFDGVSNPELRMATIRHKIFVSPKVGDSVVIHGVRGDCGQEPPSWRNLAPGFPSLKTGVLSEGRIGVRFSRACGGNTPAREVVFTAKRPGSEKITLFGDTTTIEVK